MQDSERIAKLEQHAETMEKLLHEMRNDMKRIKDELQRGKGVVYGVTLTVSVLWATAIGLWNIVKVKIS